MPGGGDKSLLERLHASRTFPLLLFMAAIAIFVAKSTTALGFAHGSVYVGLVMLSLATGKPRVVIGLGGLCMALTAAGYFLSPEAPAGFPLSYVLANRTISLVSIGLVAGVGVAYLSSSEKRVKAEQRARSIEHRTAERLTTTLESITDALFLLDPEWRFTFANARVEKLLRRSRDELIGRNILETFPEARGSRFEREYRKAIETGESVRFEAWFGPLESWFRVHAYPSAEGLAVYFQDITGQQESKNQLRLLQTAINHINDIVLITEAEPLDEPGPRIVYVNDAFERLTGYSRDEVLGRSPRILQGPETDRAELDRIRAALENRQPVRSRLVNYRKDGATYWLEIDIVPLAGETGEYTHMVAVQRDITETLAMEEQLRQAQRMEAIGQLTGGIAHDFNNLLTVIVGNAELLGEALADNRRARMLAEMVGTAGQRGAELTRRLLTFARQQSLEPRPVAVDELVEGMLELLRRTLGGNIRVELDAEPDCPPAMVDPGQLESAILNLAINSRDAMPDGGTLTIRVGPARPELNLPEQEENAGRGRILVTVTDTGHGIPADRRKRVFEPFYSTKEDGKGSGLGLPMIYGFIQQSGGQIELDSEVGRGTTVRLHLPVATQAGSVPDDTRSESPAAIGSETVLLVEDDPLVRRYAFEQLASLGYDVIEAEDGDKALAVLETRRDVDLLFTDLIMPGDLGGRALARKARTLHPDIGVLYTTGYEDPVRSRPGPEDDVLVLGKPYRRDKLADQIRAALNRRPKQEPKDSTTKTTIATTDTGSCRQSREGNDG